MASTEQLKKEIDTIDNNDKIEVQEMEEFLKSEENIKKLGEAMESDVSSELIEEFKTAIEELCEKIIKTEKKEITLNQFNILSFYFKHFDTKDWDTKTYNKTKKILSNLYKKYLKEYNKYSKGEWEKPTGVVAEYFKNLQQEKLNELKKIGDEYMEQRQLENDPLIKKQKEEWERLRKLLDRWEVDKKEIENILQKDWIISEEEIKKLLYFRDFYYKEWHISYKIDNTDWEIYEQLSIELWKSLMHTGIVGYDKIASEIDRKVLLTNEINQLIENINNECMKKFEDPLSNLNSLWLNGNSRLNWNYLRQNIQTPKDVDKIDENNVGKYINLNWIPKENYIYIANNLKLIIKHHLEINPWYISVFWWVASWMTLDSMVKNNDFTITIYKNVEKLIWQWEKEQINTIVNKIRSWNLESLEFFGIWLGMALWKKTEKEKNWTIEKIFNSFPSTNPEAFFNACNVRHPSAPNWKNPLIDLKDIYIQHWLVKEKVLFPTKDKDGKEEFLLDFSKKNKFEKFRWKWWKLSDKYDFDKAYQYTQSFYNWLKWLKIDESIPLTDTINFLNILTKKQNENQKLYKTASEKIRKDRDMVDNNPFLGYWWHVTASNAGFKEKKEVYNNCVQIEEAYVSLLLKSKNKPTWKISWISWSNLTLDFSKWNNPKTIVRDKFWEKLSDQRDNFVYNLSYDRKAAVWSAAWMIAWIIASWASCVSWNIWAAAWAFTVSSRVVNACIQESLNGYQAVYEAISWSKATWWNQTNDFWDSFMKWIWAYEQVVDENWQPILDKSWKIQYQFIWWERFWSNLAFDYLWWVAMFWAFKALWPSFEAIKSIKIAWKPLEFASKWLFVQNFGIDMPMNALHKWTDVLLWIWNPQQKYHWSILYWHNDWWQTSEWNEYYESGNIWDAFEAMLWNIEEHLSFENQSQVFFNTMMYCGMLEAWQWIAGKIKSYMPENRISKYEASSRKFQEAQREFLWKIKEKWLTLNEKFELTYTKNWAKVKDIRLLIQCEPWLIKLKGVLAEHTKATQELIACEKELSGDWSKTYGLLKKMNLISERQPPLNILKERIVKAKKEYQDAIQSWDLKKAQELKEIILDHQSAQITLISEFHPDAINNIKLSNEERIQKSKELLQSELTKEQEQAILNAHNAQWDAYNLSNSELMNKCNILFRAWFTEAQVKILIENCICGKKTWVWERTWESTSERTWELSPERTWESTSERTWESTSKRTWELSPERTWESTSERTWKLSSERTWESTPERTWESTPENEKIKFEPTAVEWWKENALKDIQAIKENLKKQLDNLEKSKCPEDLKEIINEKIKTLENEINEWKKIAEIDFDPENWTFRSFWWFEKFIENLINRWPSEINQNFLNNIKLTIDYMTKRIINVWEAEPITLKEWESRMDIWEDFMKAMEKHMINQWLDNPQYFNSHGFDHTILVHSLIVKVRNWLKECADTVAEKYKLSGEKADKLYNSLIELSAALHDLWYPAQSKNKWEKTTHATSWAELFYKELKPKFEEFVTKEIWLDTEVAGDLACDMYNAVCFHWADKVESHYVSRVEWMDNEGRLYGWTLVPRKWAITWENIRGNLDFQSFRISYKSEWFREWAPWRYAWVRNDKLEVFESVDWKTRKIVEREWDKWKVKPLKDPEDISTDAVRSSVQERQNLSRTTAFNQAIELSKNWWSDIKIYTKEWWEPIEFKRKVIDENTKKIRFEREIWGETESLEDFIKENDIIRIEWVWNEWKNHKIELNAENLWKMNEQAIDQALWWLCDLEIKTDKGTITYSKESWKYESAWKEITKEELLNWYKINEITAKVKWETWEIANWRTITVNDNAYEGRFLNNDWTWLEYRSQDLKKDPLMSMIRIADNLDMAFNRLIPSQSNAIFLTALYNLENEWDIAKLFEKMEKFNKRKKWKLKEEKPPTEQEIMEWFSKELNIDIYKIFEEKWHETNEWWDQDWKKQITRKFDFTKYYKDWKFDLWTFKQDLFDTIRDSKAIETGYWDETLDMSHDLMNEGMIGSYSVRHMVWLRPIENVDFNVDWSVEIKIDMDLYFKSDLSNRIVEEDWHNIRLVEYHLWREWTALKAVPLNWQRIKSYVVDKNGKCIWEINEKWVVDYSLMFEEWTVTTNEDGTFDYSKGIIKSEYDSYKDSPIFKNRTWKGKEKAQKN